MATDFSKKMCQQLLLYEDYIASCTTVPFQKNKIIVEREKLLDLLVELRLYHCADRQLVRGGESGSAIEAQQGNADAAQHTGFGDTLVRAEDRELELLKRAEEDAEAIKLQAKEQAMAERERILQQAWQEADFILQQAKEQEEQSRRQAMELIEAAQNKAEQTHQKTSQVDAQKEQIISQARTRAEKLVTTARESRQNKIEMAQQLAQAEREKILQDARETAAALLNEAQVQADLLLAKAREESNQNNRSKEEELEEELYDVLSARNTEALALLKSTLQKTGEYTEYITDLYQQHIHVVHMDRQEISELIEKLEQRWSR